VKFLSGRGDVVGVESFGRALDNHRLLSLLSRSPKLPPGNLELFVQGVRVEVRS
jgi:hypothetical protein